jgi:gliding motility-associated protein GldM
MALPKEPRQKMINLMYLVLTAMLALNVSAEVIEAFRTVDKSLVKSNDNLESGNTGLFASLAAKVNEAGVDKAKLATWTANAQTAKKLSDEFNTYLDGLKLQLKTMSGFKNEKNEKGQDKFKEDDLNASSNLMDNEKKGEELDNKLKAYRAAMLAIDPAIATEFATTFPVEVDATKDATTNSFRMMPTVAAVTLLSKYQNNIKNAENQVVTFCHNQVGQVKFIYDQFKPIIGTSSTYLMPGEQMTVTAGIGSFSKSAAPVITINGVSQGANADGVAERTFPVSGSGSVNVVVTYTKPDGSKGTETKSIPYTVGIPGGSAVMLDKMNVFYIGVDNPVTIGSPTGWDKTNVSMTGGSISGTGSKRVVKVSAIGTASITVTADGHPSTFPFRIKRIPDPIIKVGPSGGGKMQAVVFRNQQFVRADLENFDFEARFQVTGATVYFMNPGDRNVKSANLSSGALGSASEYMKTLVPGSTVIFDNITVVGPDGVKRTIQNPPGFSLN